MPLPEPTCRESYGAWLADMRSALLHKILLMHPPIGIRLPRFRFFNRSFQQLSQTNSCPTHFHLRQELKLFYMVEKKKKTTCWRIDNNSRRYHKTIRPLASTTVRGFEYSPKEGLGNFLLFLSRPFLICSQKYSSISQGIFTIKNVNDDLKWISVIFADRDCQMPREPFSPGALGISQKFFHSKRYGRKIFLLGAFQISRAAWDSVFSSGLAYY